MNRKEVRSIVNDSPLAKVRPYTTNRGFHGYEAEKYQNEPFDFRRLIQESSAVGEYEDSLENPGSSFLWIGEHFHLNREEVQAVIAHMQRWLDTGSLKPDEGRS